MDDSGWLWELSLSRIQREPHGLFVERSRLSSEMEEVASINCRHWIAAADAAAESTRRCADVHGRLQKLQKLVGDYGEAVERVDTTMRERQRKTTVIQRKLNEVMDVLEIPHLMASCVRAGAASFDDALDLWMHVVDVGRDQSSHVVQEIVQQVQDVSIALRDHRLAELETEKMHLTELLKLIGHLSRLGCFSPAQLRQEFLYRREKFIRKEIKKMKLGEANKYLYISKLLDFFRVHVFEVIAQYNALFVEASDQSGQLATKNLHVWIAFRIQSIMSDLADELTGINEISLMLNILKQGLACAHSLASVGVDFRALFVVQVEKRILQIYSNGMTFAVESAIDTLRTLEFKVPQDLLIKLGIQNEESSFVTQILEFPCLAALHNLINKAIVDLSSGTPLNLIDPVLETTQKSLEKFIAQVNEVGVELKLSEEDLGELFFAFGTFMIPNVFSLLGNVFEAGGYSTLKIHQEPVVKSIQQYMTTAIKNPLNVANNNAVEDPPESEETQEIEQAASSYPTEESNNE